MMSVILLILWGALALSDAQGDGLHARHPFRIGNRAGSHDRTRFGNLDGEKLYQPPRSPSTSGSVQAPGHQSEADGFVGFGLPPVEAPPSPHYQSETDGFVGFGLPPVEAPPSSLPRRPPLRDSSRS